jgi:ATP synthase subunit 6
MNFYTTTIATPLEQFEILPLFTFFFYNEYFVFTNASLALLFVFFTLVFSLYLSAEYKATVLPNCWQSIVESIYIYVLGMVRDTIGSADGDRYFPFIFVSFLFILACNLLGMIPYTFTVTSHILITFSLGMLTFLGINIIAFRKHGLHFFYFFVPQDAPGALIPFLFFIEVLSYVFRVLSLSIRLFANMMAGHTLLKILAGFAWSMLSIGGIFFILQLFPLAIVFALIGLEIGIAILQAYVWTVLVCIYLNDALHLH